MIILVSGKTVDLRKAKICVLEAQELAGKLELPVEQAQSFLSDKRAEDPEEHLNEKSMEKIAGLQVQFETEKKEKYSRDKHTLKTVYQLPVDIHPGHPPQVI